MGMIRKVSSQIRSGRAKELAIVRFTSFWVGILKSILLLGVQKLKQILIHRPFYRKSSADPNDTLEEKSVCISNEIQDEKTDSDIEVNTDTIGIRNAEQDNFESSSTEETIAEIEKCEDITDEESESESDRRNENQTVDREDFIEETTTDYFKNFSLYSVLFLPTISIQFYVSVLLLLFYAYRKKLFAKYLEREEESNRVKATESNPLAQSENCKENTGSEMPQDGGSQQITIERKGIWGKENDHEKSEESMITSESLPNVHETGTLINVIIPGNDLGKVEAQNIINEFVESKIKKDVGFEEHTLDNLEEIKLGTDNEEMASTLSQQENQISINKDELHARNEIRNSISTSDEDSKDDSKDKSSKAESNTLVVSEIIPNGTEQISVSGIKISKSTSFPSCLVDKTKKEIQSENPKMKGETINNESNEVCFLKDDILNARALKEAETFKADGKKYPSNEIGERSNQQSKKTCFSKIEGNKLNGLITSLTNCTEMREIENTENNMREVQSKDVSFRSVGENPLQKDLFKYGTDKEKLENLSEDNQDYKVAVSNAGESDAQITTSASNDGIQKHVGINLKEFGNKQGSLSKGYEPNHLRKINVVWTVIGSEGAENVVSKPRMKESNTNDQMDSNGDLRPEIKNITFGIEQSLDETEVLDLNYKTHEDSTYINTETENTEKVLGEKELDEFVSKDEVAYLMHTKSTCIREEVKVVSKRCTKREINEDQASVGKFLKENNPNSHEAFDCSENSTKNEQFTDSVERETVCSEKFVDETISASNNSLKLIYGPLIFKTSVDDGSEFAFKFRSGVKHKEINNKANRSCEISFKKL